MSGKVDTTVDPSLLEIDGEDPSKTADAILKALIERRSYPGAKYKEGGATLAELPSQEVLNLAVRIQIACGSDGNPSLQQLKLFRRMSS